jgi:hypothetical protein
VSGSWGQPHVGTVRQVVRQRLYVTTHTVAIHPLQQFQTAFAARRGGGGPRTGGRRPAAPGSYPNVLVGFEMFGLTGYRPTSAWSHPEGVGCDQKGAGSVVTNLILGTFCLFKIGSFRQNSFV